MRYILLLLFGLFYFAGYTQTYRAAFDRIDQVGGLGDISYYVNTSINHELPIIEPGNLDAYLNMYMATLDKKYLDKFIIHAKRVQDRRDDDAEVTRQQGEIPNGSTCNNLNAVPNEPDSKTWSTDKDWADCSDCNGWHKRFLYTGTITFPMANFIHIMKTHPVANSLLNESLPAEVYNTARAGSYCYRSLNTYSDFIDWLQCRLNESLQYHNQNWCSTHEVYMLFRDPVNPCFTFDVHYEGDCNLGSTECPFPQNHTECGVKTNTPEALNMQCALGRTVLMMYLVEAMSGNASLANEYYQKAVALANLTKSKMIYVPSSSSYTWCHDDDCEFIEDLAHASLPMRFAQLCNFYNIGAGIFTNTDIERLGNTFANKLYKAPLLANQNTYNNIVGSNSGSQAIGSDINHLLGTYGFMSAYNPYVYQIISDMYCGGATGSCSLSEYNPLSTLIAYSQLALYERVLNPIAVKRDNTAKQWSGATGGDFDGDGDQEMVAYNKTAGNFVVYDLNPNHSITAGITSNQGTQIMDIGSGELNSSNAGDEVVSIDPNGNVTIYSKNSTNFTPICTYQIPFTGSPDNVFTGIEVGDILDFLPGNEIVISNSTMGFLIVISYDQVTNTMTWQSNSTGSIQPAYRLTVGNFDPTRPGDEICTAHNSGYVRIHEFTNPYYLAQLSELATPVDPITNKWKTATSGDYDGDGTDEIMVTKEGDGRAMILKYKNNALSEMRSEYFKPDQLIASSASFKSGGRDVLAFLRNYDGQITIFNTKGLCTDLELTDQVINDNTSINNIYTGTGNNYPIDYHSHSLLAVSNFSINDNGTTVIFTAGEEISMTGNFSANPGTEMSAYIDDALDCYSDVFRKSNPSHPTENETPVSKQNNASVVIFPNPSTGEATVNYYSKSRDNVSITILNISGQVVYDENVSTEIGNNDIPIDLRESENGIYIIRVKSKTEKEIKTGKIVIIR